MSDDKPRVLRDVTPVSYGPDLTGMGEILSVAPIAEDEDSPERDRGAGRGTAGAEHTEEGRADRGAPGRRHIHTEDVMAERAPGRTRAMRENGEYWIRVCRICSHPGGAHRIEPPGCECGECPGYDQHPDWGRWSDERSRELRARAGKSVWEPS